MNEQNIPNYQKLFGEIDVREGDEARSVYSPAAYLTDLLQVIDDEIKSPAALKEAVYPFDEWSVLTPVLYRSRIHSDAQRTVRRPSREYR